MSAAETFQLSGDRENARVENQKVASIGLRRLANGSVRAGQRKRAAEILAESITIHDSAEARTSLALIHMQLGEIEDGINQARYALHLEPKNADALDTLAKLLYLKADYAAALPVLERLFGMKPDFDAAYTLGMTYLQLKQLDRAKLLFEEMLTAVTKKASLHMLLGKAFEDTNYPLEAEREFRTAIKADPKMTGAHFYLGFTILQHGGSERLEEAGREFDLELKMSPRDPFPNFFAGVVASSAADHPKAIRFLQIAVRLKPNLGPAFLFLGQSQMEVGDHVAAEKNLRTAIALNDDPSKNSFQIRRAYFLLGRLQTKLGRKAEGEKNLAKAQELQGQLLESARDDIRRVFDGIVSAAKPLDAAAVDTPKPASTLTPAEALALKRSIERLRSIVAQAYHNIGVIESQNGRLDRSIEKFASASAWRKDFPGLDRNWGIVLFRANEFDKAVVPLARHLTAQPSDILVRRMLGVSYYFSRNYGSAVAALKPIESAIVDDPEQAYFYGIALIQLQRHPEANAVFLRIADRHSRSAQAQYYAGQGLVLSGSLEKAAFHFKTASKIDPAMRSAHYNAGQALIRMNRLGDAEFEFREELRLDPSNVFAKYHLAYTLLERKIGGDEAVKLLREAIDTKYDYADARYQLGKVLIERDAIDEAIEQLQTAAVLEPKKDYIQYQLSVALRKASRIDEADKALKLYTDLKAENRGDSPAARGNKKNEP